MESNGDGIHAVVDSLARTPLSVVLGYAVALTFVRWGIHSSTFKRKSWSRHILQIVGEIFDAVIYASVLVFFLVRPFILQAYNIPSGSMVSTLLVDDYIVANKAIYRYRDPQIGDIVVFRPPKAAARSFERDDDGEVNVDFIKRCVGVPGDVVEIRQDVLYRNGKQVEEPFRHFMIEDPPGQDISYREMRVDEYATHLKEDFKLVRYQGEYWPLITVDDGVNDSEMTASEFRISNDRLASTLRSLPPIAVPKGFYLMFGDNRFHSFDGRSWGLVPRESIIGRAEAIWMPLQRAQLLRGKSGQNR